MALKSALRGCL